MGRLIMKDLLNLLVEGNYTLFIVLASMIIFVWLFKDIKKSLLETKNQDLDFLDQSINSYAQVLKTIYFYLNNSTDEHDLISNMYLSYKYFDKSIIEKIDYFTSHSFIMTPEKKSQLLTELSKEIKNKLQLLKNKQLHSIIDKNYAFSTLEIFDALNRNHFDVYCNAFIYSILIFTVSLILLIISLNFLTLNALNVILLIIYVPTFIFWLISILISIELLLGKHYKRPLLFILFVFLPVILTYFIVVCPYSIIKLFLVIIFSTSVVASFFVNVKYSKRIRNKN
jgi:hypothetical protein